MKPKMNKLEGVFTVMVTPFTDDGEVDYAGLRKNVSWQIEQGIHGLIPLGSTGEFASLEDDEKRQIAETVIDEADGRVPAVVGATAETTEKAIEYARHAQDIGAAGVLILPSYYCNPSQEEMYGHFSAIAEAIDIPIMLYNNPWSSGVDMQLETVVRLAKIPNIAYIKESTSDMRRFTNIRQTAGDNITLFCGWEDLAYEQFVMGAKGWVCVVGNIAPKLAVDLYNTLVVDRDLDRGWDLYCQLLPIMRYLEYSGKLQQTLKYALKKLGLAGGPVRSPKLPLSAEQQEEVDAMLSELGIG